MADDPKLTMVPQKAFEDVEDAVLGLVSVVEPMIHLLITRGLTTKKKVDQSLAERAKWFREKNQPSAEVVVERIRRTLRDPDRELRRMLFDLPPEGTA